MAMIQDTNRLINSTTIKPITDVTKLDPNKTYDLTAEGYIEHKDPLKEKWYKAKEAAKEAGVKISDIRNSIAMGRLVATKIPEANAAGYIYMVKETDLIDWLDDKNKVRDQKVRDKYNSKRRKKVDIPKSEDVKVEEAPKTVMYDPISGQQFIANEEEIKATNKEIAAQFELERERHYAQSLKDVHEIDPKTAVKLDVLMAHIQALIDNSYKKGFEDGKLSVEFDKSDEYGRGFEDGKKQAKEELLAKLKED